MRQVKSLLLDYFRGRQVRMQSQGPRCGMKGNNAAVALGGRLSASFPWPGKAGQLVPPALHVFVVALGRIPVPCSAFVPLTLPCPMLCLQVDTINLAGLDRVIFVTQHPHNKQVLLRQYSVRYKKSGA